MRAWIIFLLCITTASAQRRSVSVSSSTRGVGPAYSAPYSPSVQPREEPKLENPVPPSDPWRIVDGEKVCIAGPGWRDFYFPDHDGQWQANGRRPILAKGWVSFSGEVIEVQPRGIRVRGLVDKGNAGSVFFIERFPYQVAEESFVSGAAKAAGVYTYPTVLGGTSTIHNFDYGLISTAPPRAIPSLEELNQQRQASLDKKTASQARSFQINLELAKSGDPLGQWRLGQMYRDGEGVAKDTQAARAWFAKAAAQGQKDAAADLASFPAKK